VRAVAGRFRSPLSRRPYAIGASPGGPRLTTRHRVLGVADCWRWAPPPCVRHRVGQAGYLSIYLSITQRQRPGSATCPPPHAGESSRWASRVESTGESSWAGESSWTDGRATVARRVAATVADAAAPRWLRDTCGRSLGPRVGRPTQGIARSPPSPFDAAWRFRVVLICVSGSYLCLGL
jgi:hypothetical protein